MSLQVEQKIYRGAAKLRSNWTANIKGQSGEWFIKGHHAIVIGKFPQNPEEVILDLDEVILRRSKGTVLEEFARISLGAGTVDVKRGKGEKVKRILESLNQAVVHTPKANR